MIPVKVNYQVNQISLNFKELYILHKYGACHENTYFAIGKKKMEMTNLSVHYDNTPMQYTAIFHGCKNDNFLLKIFDYFSLFCSKHRL